MIGFLTKRVRTVRHVPSLVATLLTTALLVGGGVLLLFIALFRANPATVSALHSAASVATLAGKIATSSQSAAVKASPAQSLSTAAANQTSGQGATAKAASGAAAQQTALPACVPDTADASLSPIDLSAATNGLTLLVDSTHYYQIYGRNSSEVRAQIAACAPRLSGEDSFTGDTTYRLNWQYNYTYDGQSTTQCRLSDVRVGIHIAEVLPSLQTTPAYGALWQTFITNLNTHEQGHVTLDKQYANQILSDLQNLPSTSCDTIGAAVGAKINSDIQQLDAANDAYDAQTNHGATQGAIIP